MLLGLYLDPTRANNLQRGQREDLQDPRLRPPQLIGFAGHGLQA